MGILELPATALVIALVTLQLCNARYHRGGPVYWSADMPKWFNMYNTSYSLSPSPPKKRGRAFDPTQQLGNIYLYRNSILGEVGRGVR
jgi:hypothetical protein